MNDLEDNLRNAPLEKPSTAHDAAIQRIFTEATLQRPPLWSANIALWKCAAACAICLTFGYLLHAYIERPQQQPALNPESIVYVIPPDPDLRGAFEAVRMPKPSVLDPKKLRVRILPATEQQERTS